MPRSARSLTGSRSGFMPASPNFPQMAPPNTRNTTSGTARPGMRLATNGDTTVTRRMVTRE